VRILFAFAGGRGHLNPLVPLARAARDAGHDVAFAGGPTSVGTIESLGFRALGPRRDPKPRPRTPLREVDVAFAEAEFRENFAGEGARRRAAAVLEQAGEWRPDVLVAEEADFGALVAAERLGVPHATVLVLGTGRLVRPELVPEPLDALRAEHGLPPDPELAMLRRHLVLSPFPPGYRELPENALAFRSFDPAAAEPHEPAVYFTLGTEFNVESGDLYSRVLAGLEELDVAVTATVGSDVDPEELGPRPERVRVGALRRPGARAPALRRGRLPRRLGNGGRRARARAAARRDPARRRPAGQRGALRGARRGARPRPGARDPDARARGGLGGAVRAYRRAARTLAAEIGALAEPAAAVRRVEQLV
jgi:hypothetical protein